MRSSRLPGIKRLDTFDFTFQPSIDRAQIVSLHELTFIERKENVIFLGPAGVGKTHLANLSGSHRSGERPLGVLQHPFRLGLIHGGG